MRVGFGRNRKGLENRAELGRAVVRPRVSVLQVSVGRCPGWSASELGLEGRWGSDVRTGRGSHLEGSLGPAAEGLLLAAQLVALAQLQEPLPTQLLQPCVHRTSKGTEVGGTLGSLARTRRTWGAGSRHGSPPRPSPRVPREPGPQARRPAPPPRPEGPQGPGAVRVTGRLSLPPPGGHEGV